jgi:phosphoserine phosphatase
MDSTMIGQECIDELAAEVGLKGHVAEITERAMRGEIAFEPALRERVALLKGLPVSVVDRVIAERITLTPGGPALVRTMRAHGAIRRWSPAASRCSRSASPHDRLHENRANVLIVENGTPSPAASKSPFSAGRPSSTPCSI